MSKLIWAGMAGFFCGMKYGAHPLCWKRMKRKTMKMMKRLNK